MVSIPASGVELTALSYLDVREAADPDAATRTYRKKYDFGEWELTPNSKRSYRADDPLGKSLGRVITHAASGTQFLQIESYWWKSSWGGLSQGRVFETSYIRLDERDQTWRVELPGGVGGSEADAVEQFKREYRENYMILANWQGIPEPLSVTVFDNKGTADFQLTYAGGVVVVWSTFKELGLAEKLSLLKSGPTTPFIDLNKKGGGKTSNLLPYLAGGGVLLLMGVVIVLQYLKKRRKATDTNG